MAEKSPDDTHIANAQFPIAISVLSGTDGIHVAHFFESIKRKQIETVLDAIVLCTFAEGSTFRHPPTP